MPVAVLPAEPVAPQVGVELRPELAGERRPVGVRHEVLDRRRDVELPRLAALESVPGEHQIGVERISEASRLVAPPRSRDEGESREIDRREPKRSSLTGDRKTQEDSNRNCDRCLAGDCGEAEDQPRTGGVRQRPVTT